MVLTTVGHFNCDVYRLRLEGEAQPLEPTGGHQLYSATRGEWVAASTLQAGERLQTRTGERTIASIERLQGTYRVYNLEVEREHCYFVGNAQVLAHNACSRTNYGPEHGFGNVEHNNAIEDLLDEAEASGATDLRKNRVQRDVDGSRVYDTNGDYMKPDASYINGGVRYNYNRVSNLNDLERELNAFRIMNEADPDAVNSLEF